MTDAFMGEYLAKKWSGLCVALEHRFYGKSQPFAGPTEMALENLRLLTSQQAL